LVAGVEYFSGREPGGGCRFRAGRGRPLDIAGSTATASPILPRPTRVCYNKTAQIGRSKNTTHGISSRSPLGSGDRECGQRPFWSPSSSLAEPRWIGCVGE
jgi:hypothetical protein